jgi:hypothetical protein
LRVATCHESTNQRHENLNNPAAEVTADQSNKFRVATTSFLPMTEAEDHELQNSLSKVAARVTYYLPPCLRNENPYLFTAQAEFFNS